MVQNPDQETIHYWERWLSKHPERRDEFELARQTVKSMQYKHRYQMPAQDYDDLFIKLRLFKKETDHELSNMYLDRHRRMRHLFLKVAAVITFFLTFLFTVYFLVPYQPDEEDSLALAMVHKEVPPGAKSTFRLSDGTVVRLNAGSKISYPAQFASHVRELSLEGEAYFEVVKDSERPFIIHTGELQTAVLGTSFNVRYLAREENIEVALVSGVVKINDAKGAELLLNPTEMAVYSRNNQILTKKNFDARLVTAWKDNILLFEKATLSDIITQLENWYGVEIEVQLNSPIVGLYSGEYIDKSLEIVLEGIGYASGFQFKIDGKQVRIQN
ncbi:MAG: DUF4974 domain-containing protein [Cyclobacteriaceae bacterium]|nr:DUF4974 domain-containing protein [Cyclobacteriaceae bacterium]